MMQNSRCRELMIAFVLALFVFAVQASLMAQNLGTAPQVNVAVQGQQATQPEGTFLNLINWIGNVIAPVGAGGARRMHCLCDSGGALGNPVFEQSCDA